MIRSRMTTYNRDAGDAMPSDDKISPQAQRCKPN